MTRDVTFVPATIEDAFMLAQTMRPKDIAECAACNLTPFGALEQSLRLSQSAWAVKYGSDVGAMLGVIPGNDGLVLGHADELWFLTGQLFYRKRFSFLRAAREVVRQLLRRYPVLVNFVDARHDEAIGFLRALGGELGAAVPFGPNRMPFIPFRFRRAP